MGNEIGQLMYVLKASLSELMGVHFNFSSVICFQRDLLADAIVFIV